MVRVIRWYQKFISPVTPKCCRFIPSCSEYAAVAMEKYGVFGGSLRAVWRILRCNPLNRKTGVDWP